MKFFFLGCGLLLAWPGLAQHRGVGLTPAKPVTELTPAQAYLNLVNELGQLLRRALAEPSDAKALALLEGPEAMGLVQRQQALRPAFSQWLQPLSMVQREKVFQHVTQQGGVVQYVDSLASDTHTQARFEHNVRLKSALQGLIYHAMN